MRPPSLQCCSTDATCDVFISFKRSLPFSNSRGPSCKSTIYSSLKALHQASDIINE